MRRRWRWLQEQKKISYSGGGPKLGAYNHFKCICILFFVPPDQGWGGGGCKTAVHKLFPILIERQSSCHFTFKKFLTWACRFLACCNFFRFETVAFHIWSLSLPSYNVLLHGVRYPHKIFAIFWWRFCICMDVGQKLSFNNNLGQLTNAQTTTLPSLCIPMFFFFCFLQIISRVIEYKGKNTKKSYIRNWKYCSMALFYRQLLNL